MSDSASNASSVILDSEWDTSNASSDDWTDRDDPGSITKFEQHECGWCGDASFLNEYHFQGFCGECHLERVVQWTPCISFKYLVEKRHWCDGICDVLVSFLLPEDSFVAFIRAYLRKMLMGYHHLPMYLWDADGIWGAMHKNTPFVT